MSKVGTAYIEVEGDFDKFDRDVKTKGSGLAGLFGGIGKTAGVALGAGLVGAGALTGLGVKFASEAEQITLSLETILGPGEKTQKFLGELKDFAATTPFEFPGLAQASSRLLAVGTNADQVIPIMRTLGDSTSAMGTGADGIDRSVQALTKMSATGKVTSETLLQLQEAGVLVGDGLAEMLGVTAAEIPDLVSEGAVGVEDVFKVLETSAGASLERLSGGMAKQAQTVEGLTSTLVDNVKFAFIDAFEPILPTIKNLIDEVGPVITGVIEPIANGLGGFVDGLLPAFEPLLGMFTELGPAIGEAFTIVGEVFGQLGAAIAPAVALLGGPLTEAFESLSPVISSLADGIGPAFDILAQSVAELLPAVAPLVDAFLSIGSVVVTVVADALGAVLPPLLGALVPVLETAAPIIEQVGAALGASLGAAISALAPILPTIADAFGAILTAVLPLIEPLANLAVVLVNSIGVPVITAIAEAFSTLAQALVPVAETLSGALGGAIERIAVIFGEVLGPALETIGPLFSTLVGAVTPLLEPLLEIATVVLDLGLDILGPIAVTVAEAFVTLVDAVGPLVELLGGTLGELLGTVGELLGNLIAPVLQAVAPLFSRLLDAIAPLAASILPILGRLLGSVAKVLGSLLEAILPLLTPLLELAVLLVEKIGVPVIEALAVAIVSLVEALLPLVEVVANVLAAGFDIFGDIINALFSLDLGQLGEIFGDFVSASVEFLGTLLPAIGGWITGTALPFLIEKAPEWVKAFVDWIKELPGRALDLLRNLITAYAGFYRNVISFVVEKGKELVPKVLEWIGKAVTEAPGKLAEFFGAIADWVSGLPGKLAGLFVNGATWLLDAGRNIIDGLVEGISRGTQVVKDAIVSLAKGAWNSFTDFFSIFSPSRLMAEGGRYIVEGLRQGLEENAAQAVAGIDAISEAVLAASDTIPDELSARVSSQLEPVALASEIAPSSAAGGAGNTYALTLNGVTNSEVDLREQFRRMEVLGGLTP